ncbi:hypothetical protein SAMN05428975_1222 [Mucilaginibacter sp. OK268]|nr:hypothetical protein SAMN05428975_1222 [Mucilaginibacter sp. OK268]
MSDKLTRNPSSIKIPNENSVRDSNGNPLKRLE